MKVETSSSVRCGLQVVPWDKKQYGNFFSGDSYIVLHTYISKEGKGPMAWDVHFWIGDCSSQGMSILAPRPISYA